MNRFYFLLLLFLFISSSASTIFPQSSRDQIKELVGTWRSIANQNDNVEILIKIKKNGEANYRVGVKIIGTYFFQNKKLITIFKNSKTKKIEIDTTEIVIKNNFLYQKRIKNNKANVVKMKRVGKSKRSNNLLGKWETNNYKGYKAITEFGKFNNISVFLIIKTIDASYALDKNILTFFSDNSFRMRMSYKITKNIMTLHNYENGKDLTMYRIKKNSKLSN